MLADLDVTFGQGYVIARPLPPWSPAAPDASQTCATSFTVSLAQDPSDATGDLREHALERIVTRLSRATDHLQLVDAMEPIAAELRADHVVVLRRPAGTDELHMLSTGAHSAAVESEGGARATLDSGQILQVLAGDPMASPGETAMLAAQGFRSLLRLPDRLRGRDRRHPRGVQPRATGPGAASTSAGRASSPTSSPQPSNASDRPDDSLSV